MLEEIHLNDAELRSNYQHWLNKWQNRTEPSDEILNIFRNKLFPTHTFSYQKEVDGKEIVLYENILSSKKPNGILSNGARRAHKMPLNDDKSSRNFPQGLENYVFSYLGIHQPYYARLEDDKIGIKNKPFGVFIANPNDNPGFEAFPYSHASRRDIGKDNDEVDQKNTIIEFLLPLDARILMAYQVFNDPSHDQNDDMSRFWHYYGNTALWEGDYSLNSWKKKAEFRFFERVECNNLAAILWPIWQESADEHGNYEISKTVVDLPKYEREHPNIHFITYDLDLTDPEICFIEASYVALAYYLRYDTFPESINLAKDILNI